MTPRIEENTASGSHYSALDELLILLKSISPNYYIWPTWHPLGPERGGKKKRQPSIN